MLKVRWDDFLYTREQFGLWRAAFGLYLVVCYARVYPYGVELFGRNGTFPDWKLSAGPSFFPRFLFALDSDNGVKAMMIASIFLAVLIMLGFYRKIAALLLWVLVMWFYNRNSIADSPEYGFVNWLIFACIFIPEGEAFSLSKPDLGWRMPKFFYWGAWIVLGFAYFYAASSKFRGNDPAWVDGTAMYYVFVTDNARLAWYGRAFDKIPKFFFIPISYGALAMQMLSLVFMYFRKSRPWWWLVSTATHVGLLFFVNLGQLTFGMIFFHFFLFDSRWIEAVKRRLARAPEAALGSG